MKTYIYIFLMSMTVLNAATKKTVVHPKSATVQIVANTDVTVYNLTWDGKRVELNQSFETPITPDKPHTVSWLDSAATTTYTKPAYIDRSSMIIIYENGEYFVVANTHYPQWKATHNLQTQ